VIQNKALPSDPADKWQYDATDATTDEKKGIMLNTDFALFYDLDLVGPTPHQVLE
jgi:hypothetical protein